MSMLDIRCLLRANICNRLFFLKFAINLQLEKKFKFSSKFSKKKCTSKKNSNFSQHSQKNATRKKYQIFLKIFKKNAPRKKLQIFLNILKNCTSKKKSKFSQLFQKKNAPWNFFSKMKKFSCWIFFRIFLNFFKKLGPSKKKQNLKNFQIFSKFLKICTLKKWKKILKTFFKTA